MVLILQRSSTNKSTHVNNFHNVWYFVRGDSTDWLDSAGSDAFQENLLPCPLQVDAHIIRIQVSFPQRPYPTLNMSEGYEQKINQASTNMWRNRQMPNLNQSIS